MLRVSCLLFLCHLEKTSVCPNARKAHHSLPHWLWRMCLIFNILIEITFSLTPSMVHVLCSFFLPQNHLFSQGRKLNHQLKSYPQDCHLAFGSGRDLYDTLSPFREILEWSRFQARELSEYWPYVKAFFVYKETGLINCHYSFCSLELRDWPHQGGTDVYGSRERTAAHEFLGDPYNIVLFVQNRYAFYFLSFSEQSKNLPLSV